MTILDVTDPSDPIAVGHVSGRAVDCEVAGDIAFVSGAAEGVSIYDVSDSTSPALLSQLVTVELALSTAVNEDTLFVASGNQGLYSVDISMLSDPEVIRWYRFNFDQVNEVVVDGKIAYLADSDDGLYVLDISDPANVVTLDLVETQDEIVSLKIQDGRAYVADSDAGLLVYDVTAPTMSFLIGEYSQAGSVFSVFPFGDLAVMLNFEQMHIIDVRDPKGSAVIGMDTQADPAEAVTVVGDIAYLSCGSQGLRIVDVSNPANPVQLGMYTEPNADMFDAQVVGNVAYLAADRNGLIVVDVSDPSDPVRVGGLLTNDSAQGVRVVGDRAYVSDLTSGLAIFDVNDASSPVLLGTYDTPDRTRRLDVAGDLVYIADETTGLVVVDASNPASIQLVGMYDTLTANDVIVSGHVAYVADRSSVLTIDVTDPANLSLIGSLATTRSQRLDLVEDTLYVAEEIYGMTIVDVHDPSQPSVIGLSQPLTGRTEGVSVQDDLAFIALGSEGLQVLDVSDCPGCEADLNEDGELNFFDVSAFLKAYAANDTSADFNGDGSYNFFDVSAFLTEYLAGCP
ncbi:MAG: GC-type dockerin domain-anchored protein [Phycisphaerales bacterium JB052]